MNISQSIDPVIDMSRKPPGPRGLPIVGNALNMGSGDIIAHYMDMWQEYGDIIYIRLGPLDGYTLFSPDFTHHVLVKNQKNYIKGIGYDGFRLLVGQGLVTSDGELWRRQRSLMQPPFTPRAMPNYFDMMVEVTQGMLNRWEVWANNEESFVMDQEMLRLTMSIIGRAMFSIDLGEEMTEVGEALDRAFAFIPSRTNSLIPLSLPLPFHRQFKADLEIINRFIAERIAAGRQGGSQDNLLSILLQARDEKTGRHMEENQLRDEVVTLFFAGFETTARSLTWGWYLLTRHPQVIESLEAEADRLLVDGLPMDSDMGNLVYTKMVVDETLRMYPPTALLARQNVEPDEIGGYYIPPKAMIILVPYAVHRYPEIWENPERFDPQRFTPEAVLERPKNAYIPFAAGPRVCLGNNFALQEMLLAFSMTAARYHIEAVSDEEISFEFAGTIQPTQPLRVTARER